MARTKHDQMQCVCVFLSSTTSAQGPQFHAHAPSIEPQRRRYEIPKPHVLLKSTLNLGTRGCVASPPPPPTKVNVLDSVCTSPHRCVCVVVCLSSPSRAVFVQCAAMLRLLRLSDGMLRNHKSPSRGWRVVIAPIIERFNIAPRRQRCQHGRPMMPNNAAGCATCFSGACTYMFHFPSLTTLRYIFILAM